jgi:hypothetical protein
MEPIRFADILFVFITLLITFTILWMVNKAKTKSKKTTEDSPLGPSEAVVPENNDA